MHETKDVRQSLAGNATNQEMRRRLHAALDAELDRAMVAGKHSTGEITWKTQDGVIQSFEFGTFFKNDCKK